MTLTDHLMEFTRTLDAARLEAVDRVRRGQIERVAFVPIEAIDRFLAHAEDMAKVLDDPDGRGPAMARRNA